MKEEDRLAAIVERIDFEVVIVPRGAYMRLPSGQVVRNKSFEGLNGVSNSSVFRSNGDRSFQSSVVLPF